MTTFCYPYKRGTGWRSQGFRTNPNTGANGAGGHTGFDQAMDAGTPIYAPGDGIVRNSSWVTDNYLENPWWLTQMGGDILVLDCTDGVGRSDTMPTFIFAHLSNSIAEVGQRVRKGGLIALSGNSGTASTGPHLHTEALPPNWDFNNGVYGRVDPEQYFTEWPEDIPQGAAALGPQGTTITPIREDTLSAAEKNEIIAAVKAEGQKTRDYIGQLLVSGYTVGDKKYPGGNLVGITTQTRASAALALVTEMAKNPNLTAEKAQEIIETAMKATIKVDVNVAGGNQ